MDCARARGTLGSTRRGGHMAAIDTFRRTDLEGLIRELRRAARTIRAQTLVERGATTRWLAAALDGRLETDADADGQGLEALRFWVAALEQADPDDVDLLQELLYGLDALARVHIWRETGLPLVPPERRPPADV